MSTWLAEGVKLNLIARQPNLVFVYPASSQVFKDSAAHLLAELETELPPEVVTAALERGKARELADVAAEILAEG